ncbi:MAG: exosome complex RNA-binding protein Rrp4 [Acidilobaceae archaeon]
MSKLYGKMVFPGEEVDARAQAKQPYVIQVDKTKVATVLGMIVEREGGEIGFVVLSSVYVPEPGDIVIGLVESFGLTYWQVDISSPYTAILLAQDLLGRSPNPASDDLSKLLRPGDYIKAKVSLFDKTRQPLLTVQGEDLGKITSGTVIEIQHNKIPRVIGKKRSMLTLLEEKTECKIYPAVNGRIHIECPSSAHEIVAITAIKFIEKEAHTSGLTERVSRLIEEEKRARGI